MEQDKTKVIFVKFQSEIIALFPDVPGDCNPSNCLCYAHIGQHGAASVRIAKVKATKSEYQSLKKELENVGYNLHVITRMHKSNYQARVKELLSSY